MKRGKEMEKREREGENISAFVDMLEARDHD